MTAIDILGLLVPVTYLAMLAIEAAFPARRYPPVKGWRWIGVLFLVVYGTVSTLTPLLIPVDWLAKHRLVDGTKLGIVGGVVVGYMAVSFVSFLWHRSAHAFSPMWRMTHQIHHSPVRVDISGSMLFHPTEMVAFTVIGVVVTTLLLGLDPLAAAIVFYVAGFYGLFQHLNVKTPQWLGYVIQRPESHALHHQRGVHAWNYSDFPPWDMIFGTFRNPKAIEAEAGFDPPASGRLLSMLAFVDVNAPVEGAGSRGRKPGAEPAAA